MAGDGQEVVQSGRKKLDYEAVLFAVTIAIVGFTAESITRAQFSTRMIFVGNVPVLPFVAALQLIAGVRLGTLRGIISSVVGGYAATVFVYGSFGLASILNPVVAGGFMNALLPSLLLRLFEGAKWQAHATSPERHTIHSQSKGPLITLSYLAAVVVIALSSAFLSRGNWIYLASVVLLLLVGLIFFPLCPGHGRNNGTMLTVLFVSCLMSSIIGYASLGYASGWNGIISNAVPWLLWDAIFSILGLQLLTVLDGKRDDGSTLVSEEIMKSRKTVFTGLFIAVLALSVIGSCMQFFSAHQVRLLSDSYDYLEVALQSPFSTAFWTSADQKTLGLNWWHPLLTRYPPTMAIDSSWAPPLFRPLPRPQLYPLFIRLLGSNLQLVILVQTALSISCWLLLAISVFLASRRSFSGILVSVLIVLYSSMPRIAGWDGIIQTESLSYALLAAALGCALSYLRTRKPRWLWAGASLMSLYGLVRDSDAYLVLSAALALSLFLAVSLIRKKSGSTISLVLCFSPSIMILSFFISNFTADVGKRWAFPLYQVVMGRILSNAEDSAWFHEHEMPLAPEMLRHAGTVTGSDSSYFESRDLLPFKKWMLSKGKALYIEWLVLHPKQSVLAAIEEMPRALDANIMAGQPAALYRPILFPPFSFGNFQYIGEGFFLILIIFFNIKNGQEELKGATFFILMTLVLAIPHYLVCWNGDASALFRHTSQPVVQIEVAAIILLGLSIDTVAAEISKFTSRISFKKVHHSRKPA